MILSTGNCRKSVIAQNLDVVADLSIKEAMFKPVDTAAPVIFVDESNLSENDWWAAVTKVAELSKLMSQIAVSKATNRQIKQFARFELEESIALVDVSADFEARTQAIDMAGEVTLFSMKNAAAGRPFDELYLHSQVQLHDQLTSLSKKYLKMAPAESQTRRFAVLALSTFREHLSILQQINTSMKGV